MCEFFLAKLSNSNLDTNLTFFYVANLIKL